jgi:exonuclease III
VKCLWFSMDNHSQSFHRSLKILSHNIRGINSDTKWNSLRNNILESNCDIVCIQETKKESFDDSYIRLFCNRNLDKFAHGPFSGASGGFITIWKGSLFEAEVVDHNSFRHTIRFRSNLNGQVWWLSNIYAPCSPHGREAFLAWFSNLEIDEDKLWIFLGDFNMIRYPEIATSWVVTLLECSILMRQSVSWVYKRFLSKGKLSLGQTCNVILCLKS